MVEAMGPAWAQQFSLDLAPVMFPTDRVVTLGLVVTELMINAQKYAYGGRPGPLRVQLTQDRSNFRLTISDQGVDSTPTLMVNGVKTDANSWADLEPILQKAGAR